MKILKDILISPSDNMRAAVLAIDKAASRIALVVDKNNRLLGTVTDGDVRRALIKHLTMETLVSEIMNTKPKVAFYQEDKSYILSLMKKEDLLHIPLVDREGILIDMETLQNLSHRNEYKNPVFLMAGGQGSRLRPLTNDTPKPLLTVGDRPILENILENFIEAGFRQFYISVHYKSEMIMDYFGDGGKWGVDIRYIHETSPLGTAGALGLLPADLPDLPLIIMNGDILTKINFQHLLKYHSDHQAAATICVREHHFSLPYGVVKTEEHQVVEIFEKPVQKYFVNAGIYVLSPTIFKEVEKNIKLDMPTLLENNIKKGKKVCMFPMHEYWLDIGQMNDLQKAHQDFLEGLHLT